MVEASLIFPLLLLILFGIIQWGFIFAAQVTLRASAASTVRELAVIGTTDCATLRAVSELSVSPLLEPNLLDVVLDELDPTPADPSDPDIRRVTLVYQFNVLIPWVVPGASGGTLRLRADAAMRCEQSCGVVLPSSCPGP